MTPFKRHSHCLTFRTPPATLFNRRLQGDLFGATGLGRDTEKAPGSPLHVCQHGCDPELYR